MSTEKKNYAWMSTMEYYGKEHPQIVTLFVLSKSGNLCLSQLQASKVLLQFHHSQGFGHFLLFVVVVIVGNGVGLLIVETRRLNGSRSLFRRLMHVTLQLVDLMLT